MIEIYRIQNKKGRGPWIPGFSYKWIEEREEQDKLLPWFVEFKNLYMPLLPNIYYGCGCKSIEQLKYWFSLSEYKKLKQYRFNAVKIKVNKILAESDIQCIFQRTKPLNKGATIINLY